MLEGRLFVVKGVKAAKNISNPCGRLKRMYTPTIVDFEFAAETIIKKLENSALIKKLNNLTAPEIQRLPWKETTDVYDIMVSTYLTKTNYECYNRK